MNIKHDINPLSIDHQLKENDLFKNSDISNLDFDDLKLKIVHFKKGEIIFRLGDAADSIFLIIEGEIDLIKKQSFGKTQSCVSKNKFFGHEEYFLGTKRNSIAIALKNSTITELSKENIEILLSRCNSILNNIEDSLLDLDSKSIGQIDNVLKQVPNPAEKEPSAFPMDTLKDNTRPTHSFEKEETFLLQPHMLVHDKNEPMEKRNS